MPVGSGGGMWQAKWSTSNGHAHLQDWGRWIGEKVPEKAEITAFSPPISGQFRFQLLYANTSGPVSTGITAAVKRYRVVHVSSGTPLQAKADYLVMPQLGKQHRWGESSLSQPMSLHAGKVYRLVIDEDGGPMNMSYLQHFEAYTGGPGGGKQPYNRVDLRGVRALAMAVSAPAQPPLDLSAAVKFDGKNDLDKIDKATWLAPSDKLTEWAQLGRVSNAQQLSVAAVSKAFEDPIAAHMLYIAPKAKGWDAPGEGMSYVGKVAKLPFTPRWVIAVRAKSDNGDGFGPWAGIYRFDKGTGWVLQRRFEPGKELWLAADKHTLSYHVPWAELLDPEAKGAKLRAHAHVVTKDGKFVESVTIDAL